MYQTSTSTSTSDATLVSNASGQTVLTDAAIGGHIHTSLNATSAQWALPQQNSLKFDIDGEELEFSGKEIIRLKEMLTKFIREEHPEDLL